MQSVGSKGHCWSLSSLHNQNLTNQLFLFLLKKKISYTLG